jgi:hypothetical protein
MVAALGLSFTDLRAHFEAQLRAVTRAEQRLAECRDAIDQPSFDAAVHSLQAEVDLVSKNNRSIRAVIDSVDVTTRQLNRCTAKRR